MISVTQVFGHYLPDIPAVEHAANRGTMVHDYCRKRAQRIFISKIDPECAGYVMSFDRWFEAMVDEVLFTEKEFIHPVYQYVGHPDLAVILRGARKAGALIDLKTPIQRQRIWAGQLAAYLDLVWHGGYKDRIKKAGSLQLDPDGRMAKMVWYQDSFTQDLHAFLNLMNGYRYFFGGG